MFFKKLKEVTDVDFTDYLSTIDLLTSFEPILTIPPAHKLHPQTKRNQNGNMINIVIIQLILVIHISVSNHACIVKLSFVTIAMYLQYEDLLWQYVKIFMSCQ